MSIENENGNFAKPMLCEVFEKKYVIVGEIFFNNQSADIVSIFKEEMVYTRENLTKIVDFAEDNGYDYIVLPDYKYPFMATSRKVLKNVERIKIMAKDIGWGLY